MRSVSIMMCAVLLLWSGLCLAKPLAEYLMAAEQHRGAGEIEEAVGIMQQAASEYPDSAAPYAYLGLYRGMQAGQAFQAGNLPDAGSLTTQAFELLDKAVSLEPDQPTARLYRGLMGVNVPAFLGRLNGAIEDLEYLVRIDTEHPGRVPHDMAVTAYTYLAQGYAKAGDNDKAIAAWQKVAELAPGTDAAASARDNIAALSAKAEEAPEATPPVEPGQVPALIAEGKAYIEAGEYQKAEQALRRALAGDPKNAEAYKQLGVALAMPLGGEQLYDERIHEDTDWATNKAFEIMGLLDKAVELAPNDMEARFLNGMMAVEFPFFLGKLDKGIENLQMVMESDAPDDIKAQAAYWLGYGYQKKGLTQWLQLLAKYPEHQAARMAMAGMRPPLSHFDPAEHARPLVAVDFVIAFRDELPPQTAVWIETPAGEFVKTLYVSGFSGHAREVQVVLPVYASTSGFADVDAVTGASIDTGEHVYVWNLEDAAGNRVRPGNYLVKVEVDHWPSGKYQLAAGEIEIGKRETQVVVQEGDFIPYLKLTFLP